MTLPYFDTFVDREAAEDQKYCIRSPFTAPRLQKPNMACPRSHILIHSRVSDATWLWTFPSRLDCNMRDKAEQGTTKGAMTDMEILRDMWRPPLPYEDKFR